MKKNLLRLPLKKRTSWLLLLAAMMFSVGSFSQNTLITVTGKVTDENSIGLPGINVVVKGTSTGTITDQAGNFSLQVAADAVLILTDCFSPVEVAVEGRSVIDIPVQRDAIAEKVMIGYGTTTKRELTSSLTKLDGEVVAKKPNTDPVASLQGLVAGVWINNNGTPGKAADVRIRGTVSLGSQQPLYVVDGILNDNIDYLNPEDIESIEVLKDASSLAIFGLRGSQGAILIATKKAKTGTVVNFSSTVGVKQMVNPIRMVDANGFATLYKEENQNNNTTPYDLSALTANTNWIDAVTRTGIRHTDHITVASGTQHNKLNVGLGYITDDGLIIHENLKKFTASLNDEVRLTKDVKIGVTLNAARQINPYTFSNPNQSRLDDARKVIPLISAGTKPFTVQNPNGTNMISQNIYSSLDASLQNSGVVNPVLEIENTYNQVKDVVQRYVGSFYADVSFLKNFNFHGALYADISNEDNHQTVPRYYAYNPISSTPFLYSNTASTFQTNIDIHKFQQDYLLHYKKNFGDHHLAASFGLTAYHYEYDSKMSSGSTYYVSTAYTNKYNMQAYLGRVMYDFRGKYFLNASWRDEGSDFLVNKNRWQQFGAVGGAWDVSRENFFANIREKINLLKIKGSYGVVGQQTAAQMDGSSSYATISVNPDLKGQTLQSTEVGIELNAIDNRLHVEAFYFSSATNNLVAYIDNTNLGFPPRLSNAGGLRNWGEEITATWNQPITRDWRAEVGGNITFLNNKAVDLVNGYISRSFMNNGTAESRTLTDMPIGSFYGYKVAGIFQTNADIASSPNQSSLGSYRPGDFKFEAISATDLANKTVTASSRTVIGNPTPKFIYGLFVNLFYKRFNLAIDMQGVYGNSIFRTWNSLESPFQRVNYAQFMMNRWHGAGTSNWQPILSMGDRINYNGSTYNIEDGSYFRFRNVQLGYNLPDDVLKRMKLNAFRVFVNCQNLLTLKHNQGYTAEYGGDGTAFGFDNGANAISRVTSIGVNISF